MAGSGVRIGTVWDRTTEVLSGRSGAIAAVAILSLFVPTVVQAAIGAFMAEGSARSLIGGIVSLAAGVLTIWGSLAILALATHPSTDRPAAQRQATRRLLPVIGVSVVLLIAFVLLLMPPVVALGATAFDFQAAATAFANDTPQLMPRIAPAAATFILVYTIVLVLLLFWVGARFLLVNPVLLNEPLGLRAIGRSVALTRGLTWKLIGVLILYLIVFSIAVLAAQSVVGLVFRLILGPKGIPVALFIAQVASAAVSTALVALAYAFTAQLYVATREKPATE